MKGLNNCHCGKQPEIVKSTHNILCKDVWCVVCKNKQCTQPKTVDCETLRAAKSQWNNGIITDSMFPEVINGKQFSDTGY